MISYGPFRDAVRAKNGLNHLISHKLGITRSLNMGIVWQDGDQCQFLQPSRPYPNGYSELMHITADHVKKPRPAQDQTSNLGLAWSAANTVGDAVFSYLSYTAFTAAIGVATATSTGAVFMTAFLGVEALDAVALFATDGVMTVLKATDKATGDKIAQEFKDTEWYNFMETWGPIIALPAVAHDIFLAFNIPRDARLLTDLRSQMLSRAKQVLREMRATDAFIGAGGDVALHDSYAFLKQSVHQIREELVDIKRDFRNLAHYGLPADAIGLFNDVIHWHDIADGAMADFSDIDLWLGHGAHATGQWLGSTGSWLSTGTARADLHTPRHVGSTYQAARFGGIYNSHGEAQLQVRSLFPITMHLIGGTHAKSLKGKR